MRKIFKILTCLLAVIGVCTAALVCFILIYPLFNGEFSPREDGNNPRKADITQAASDHTAPGIETSPNEPVEDASEPEISQDTQPENLPSAETKSDSATATPEAAFAAPSPSDNNEMQRPTASPTPTTPKEEIPIEYQSALSRADNYCDLMHMSKEAIYDQLISEYGESVSPEAARYAVNHVEADWNENALQKARVYSDTMHMSQTAIYDQLVSENGEKFTEAQAQYAMDNLEADWNKNALYKAKEYRETTNMTKSAIYNQLISEHGDKFSPEEASYAIKNLK